MPAPAQIVIDRVSHVYRPPRGREVLALDQVTGGIQYADGSRPSCDATHRGTTWYVAGGAGVKDTFALCGKDGGDTYAWQAIY